MDSQADEINQYHKIGLRAKQLVDGFITGLHQSPYHGFSVEFAEHKLYNFGESTRHVDWKVYARTDKLFTKRYQEETNLRCHLVVDNSASMHYPLPNKDKLRFSVFASAALANLLIRQRDVVGLKVFSDKIETETRLKSTQSHLNRIYKILAQLPDTASPKTTNIVNTLNEISEKIHRRSLVVIFSDLFQNTDEADVLRALQHLKYNRHEVILFHVNDQKTEFELDLEDRPYKFIDLETKEYLKLNPAEFKRIYKKEMYSFYQDLKIKCGSLKIDFIPVDVQEDYSKVLSTYLIKRKKMM